MVHRVTVSNTVVTTGCRGCIVSESSLESRNCSVQRTGSHALLDRVIARESCGHGFLVPCDDTPAINVSAALMSVTRAAAVVRPDELKTTRQRRTWSGRLCLDAPR